MSKHLSSIARVCALAASCYWAGNAQAQDYLNDANVYGGVSEYVFDNNWHLDNDLGWLIGGEVPVSERFGLSYEHWRHNSDLDNAPGDATVTLDRLGLNYLLKPTASGFQPYLSGGFGVNKEDFNPGGDDNNTNLDFGVGVKKYLSDHVLLRGDLKLMHVTSINSWDTAVNIGIGYVFGSRKASAPAPVASSPAPAPAPAAAPQQRDSDGDGVLDSRDRCPDTPRELAVDSNGCPILDTSQLHQQLMVNFDFDKSDVKPQYDDEIAAFAQFMKTYANTSVVIEGHTDSRGPEEYNQALSERRARAVMEKLIEDGIPASRLSAVGYGETRPLVDNDTDANRARNRRIMAEVTVQVQKQRKR